jgi:predicted transcriptional regulator
VTVHGGTTDGGRRRHGDLESAVLEVVTSADSPVTPGEVREKLDRDLAYTTVMTTLVRLHEKGVLRRERQRRAYAYAMADNPVPPEVHLAARRMRRVLESGADRRGVLARFVADLSPEDEAVLSELIRGDEISP